jgi:hypothetical protein
MDCPATAVLSRRRFRHTWCGHANARKEQMKKMERYSISDRDAETVREFVNLTPEQIDNLDFCALVRLSGALWNVHWVLHKRADALAKPSKEELDALLRFMHERGC